MMKFPTSKAVQTGEMQDSTDGNDKSLEEERKTVISDFLLGCEIALSKSRSTLSSTWIKLPISLVLMLLPLYGVDKFLKNVIKLSIPSSVVIMLVLLFSLLIIERYLGAKRANLVVSYLDLPCGWCLKWINIFFTPTFTLLPLSSGVTVAEAFEIGGVFIVGFLVALVFGVYTVWSLQKALKVTRKVAIEENIEMNDITVTADTESSGSEFAESKKQTVDSAGTEDLPSNRPENAPVTVVSPSPFALKISFFLIEFFDWFIYLLLFIIGICIYFTISYEMPLHLSLTILSYRLSLLVPVRYKKVFHPILVTGGLSMLCILIFAVMKKANIIQAYQHYKTARNYLHLFDKTQTVKPGAADVLSSLLDISIVSLSLPMFKYRSELRRFWLILIIPSVIFGIISFFGYPPLCKACGIEPNRALAFMVRSVTLALALPIVETIQGSVSMASVAGILSGILGVLSGNFLLGQKGLRVREDDYVTRGVSLGLVSSAIGAAHLLPIDPRAGALATLTFFLYGMVLVILSVIPPLVNTVRSWVGLEAV